MSPLSKFYILIALFSTYCTLAEPGPSTEPSKNPKFVIQNLTIKQLTIKVGDGSAINWGDNSTSNNSLSDSSTNTHREHYVSTENSHNNLTNKQKSSSTKSNNIQHIEKTSWISDIANQYGIYVVGVLYFCNNGISFLSVPYKICSYIIATIGSFISSLCKPKKRVKQTKPQTHKTKPSEIFFYSLIKPLILNKKSNKVYTNEKTLSSKR